MEINRDLSDWIWNNIHIDDMQKAQILPQLRWKEETIAQLEERVQELEKACIGGRDNTILLIEYAYPVYDKKGYALTAIQTVIESKP